MDTPCFYRVSVKGIVIDGQGRVLLAREDNGLWDMLGGGLDHGEDPIDCLLREVAEEAGLVVTSVSESPIYFNTAPKRDGSKHVANAIYQIELANLEFTPSDECQELRFFSLDEMSQLELYPNVRKLYEQLAAK